MTEKAIALKVLYDQLKEQIDKAGSALNEHSDVATMNDHLDEAIVIANAIREIATLPND